MKMFRWLLAAGLMALLASYVVRLARQSPPASRAGAIVATVPEAVAPAPSPAVVPVKVQVSPSAVLSVIEKPPASPFEKWAQDYAGADVARRSGLVARGEVLAQERAREMARLIRSNPEQAIRQSLPYGVRKTLPASVLAMIEQPVSARGEIKPVFYKPLPGRESEVPPTSYEVTIDKTKYTTFTYGGRKQQPGHQGTYIHGVSVKEPATAEQLLALGDQPARTVEDAAELDDLIQAGKVASDALCSVSGQKVAQSPRPAVLQFAEKYFSYCDPGHAGKFNASLGTAHGVIWGSHSGVDGNPPDVLLPLNSSWTQGLKKLLYIRVSYSDDPVSPQSDDGAQATGKANNKYFNDGSYNTVWWETTVTPVIQLPQRKNYYGENPGALMSDAASGAAALGYFTTDYYPTFYVLTRSLPQYSFGGLSSGILNGSPGAISHELGHNFGLPHANFWQPEGRAPGPVQPTNGPPLPLDPDSVIGHNDYNAPYIAGLSADEPSLEYGNPYDVMGSGPGHFSAMFKNFMNWLPDSFIKNVTASTTNRIYAFDTPTITEGRLYALRIRKDITREVWLSHRQGFPGNPWFSSGIEVDWNLNGSTMAGLHLQGNNVLVDTTPDSTYQRDDAALVVGRTLRDPAGAMHITPIARSDAGDPDKWIDVVVQKGTFPGNQSPTLSLAASALTVPVGTTVEFTGTAQDADGDPLAYHWDFGDYTFGTNGPVQSKTFDVAGYFVVRCEASDMKGGLGSAHVLVTVGTPTTFTISGRILDIYGNPVQGVRVHNSGVKPAAAPPVEGGGTNTPVTNIGTYRYGFTDSQGYYIIGNIPAGTYANRAYLHGQRIEPYNFNDPVELVDGNANNLDFTAYPIARVAIAQTSDADEAGLDGLFTLTRDGDTSGGLYVRFQLSGTAVINTDYILSPVDTSVTNIVVTTNGEVRITNIVVTAANNGQIYFPPGVSQLDLHVTSTNSLTTNNLVGDGDKSVVLTLMLQTNFYRVVTFVTNVLVTNGPVVYTNSFFVTRTNQFRVPGWEVRPVGVSATPTWFQTDPTYVIENAEATVNILDDDEPAIPTVRGITLDADALESRGDSATFLFSREGAPFDQDLVVHYQWSGVASNGLDFVLMPGTVTIPAGQVFTLVSVTAINDLFVEGNEEAIIAILPSPDGSYTGEGFGDYFTIVDDDLPLVNIFAATATATRGGGSGLVTVSRAGSLTEPLTVNYLVTGTAVSGTDFTTLSGTVTIPAGQLSANITVAPINSSTNRLPRTVTLLLSDSTLYNIYNQNSATVTLVDGTLPVLTLAKSGDTVGENGGTATFTVTRTGPTTGSLNVYFDVGGSAWPGSDYSPIGTNVVIPAGAASAVVTVTALNDSARENGDTDGQETLILQLRPGTNHLLGATFSQTIRILDDDGGGLPAVSFMLASSSVREDDGLARLWVKVSANPATNKPIRVEYRVTSGSALPGVHYATNFTLSGTTGLLNITHYTPPNPPPKFFDFENGIYAVPITVFNDGLAAGNKTLTVTLFNPSGFETNYSYITNAGTIFTNFLITRIPTNAWLHQPFSHQLTIVDVATTTVSVSAPAAFAYEAGRQAARFTITREGPTNAPLTVGYAITGTAAAGSDFVSTGTNAFVTIPAGTNSVTLVITPRDDPTEEMAESVTLTLQERPGYSLAFPISATTVLVSDDGTLQFLLANGDVGEDAGTAEVVVLRTGNTNYAATVNYLILDGTALNGADYLGTNGSLSFAPGETIKEINIPILNDPWVEPSETISLVLTNASGGAQLGGQKSATVTILNDDTEFDFTVLTYRGNENAGLARIDISRFGVLSNAQSVTLTVTNALADATDFVPADIVVEFAPGQTNALVYVQILDDELVEGDEPAALQLSAPSGGATIGSVSNATLVIVDDECILDFELAGYFVHEYSNTVTLVIRRLGGTVNPVSVDFFTSDGSATNGLDYAAGTGTISFTGDHYELDTNGSGSLFFVPGQSVRTVTLTIIDDLDGEGNEDFLVHLATPQILAPALPGSLALGTNTAATVTLLDNEMPGNVDYEFGGVGPNGPVRALALQYDNRIVIGGEFTTVDGFSFIRIARLLPNGLYDGSFNPGAGANSNVHAVASAPDGRVYLGGEFTTVNTTNRIRIARLNEDGKLDATFNVANGGANGIVRAIALQANGQVLIAGDFTQVSGIARSRIARLNSNGTLDTNFNATLNASAYALAIQPDGTLLVGGAFSLANGAPRSGLVRLNTNGTLDTSLVIGTGFNGQVNALALQADGRILAGGLFGTFNGLPQNNLARLSPDGALDATFGSGTGPNGAVHGLAVAPNKKILLGGDFQTYSGAFVGRIARLKANGSLDFLFVAGAGADNTVRAVVVQPDTAVVIGGSFTNVHAIERRHVARLHGDEKSNIATVEFVDAAYPVEEHLGPVRVTLQRTGNTNIAFTLAWSTTDGSATNVLDYTGDTNTVGFAPGQVSATLTIPIHDDLLLEGNETFLVNLTNAPSNVDLSGLTTALVVIEDNEKAIQFTGTNYFVNEGSNNAVITLTRIGGLSGAISVTLVSSNGTAQAPNDYIAVSNVVSFAAGQSNATVLLPLIVDDPTGEPAESVVLRLILPAGCFVGDPGQATLTLIDNDFTYGIVSRTNGAPINIMDAAPAIPYPSTINVTALTGLLQRVSVQFLGLHHPFPGDIDALLVGPGGQRVLLLSDAGGSFPAANLTMTFADAASGYWPGNSALQTGTNKPTDYAPADSFPSPAPAGPYGNALSVFTGTNPNGLWSLYIADDRGNDAGVISNGWRLIFETIDPALAADLVLAGTAAPEPVNAGNVLRYFFTVSNAGPNVATSVVFSNQLPSSLALSAAYPSQGACVVTNGAVVCALGDFVVGATAVVELKTIPGLGGLLTNTAFIFGQEADVIVENNVALVVSTVNPGVTADLLVQMSDAPDPVLAGQDLTYSITVTNRGPLTATGVVLTDWLPENGDLISVLVTQGTFSNGGNVIDFSVGTLPVGSGAAFTVVVRPRSGGSMSNTVTATSNQPDLTDNTVVVTTTVPPAANLVLGMGDAFDPVAVNQTVVYNILVFNAGPGAADGVTVFDVLPAQFQFLSASTTQGTNFVSGGTVIFQFGTLLNGASASAQIFAKATVAGTFTNYATVIGTLADPDASNNSAVADTTVFPTVTGGTNNSGISITRNTNAAQLAALVTGSGSTGIRVTGSRLSAHQNGASGPASSGIYTIGSVPTTYGIRAPGIVLSTGDVKEYETGTNQLSSTTTGFGPRATTAQEALLDPITGGGTNNFSHYDVSQLDIDFDMLPGFAQVQFKVVFGSEEYIEFVNSSFIDGFGIYLNGTNIAYSGGAAVNINHPDMKNIPGTELDGVLAPGNNAVVQFTANVPAGSTNNTLTFIVADTSDGILDTTVFVSSLEGGLAPNADLAVTAVSTPDPAVLGGSFIYRINVTNRGPDIATNVVVTDVLPAGLQFNSATASSGGFVVSNQTVTFNVGNLFRFAGALLTLDVSPQVAGRYTNAITASSDLADLAPGNNTAVVVSTVTDPGSFVLVTNVVIADAGPAFTYPSVLHVSGLGSSMGGLVVTLHELSHTFPADLDILLVSPQGQGVVLMSDVGGGLDVNAVTLSFDDAAAEFLPASGQIIAGSFKPTNIGAGDPFKAPAPAGVFGSALAVFNGSNPNGDWLLYIMDDQGSDSGMLAGGWQLNFTGDLGAVLGVTLSGGDLILSWPSSGVGYALESSANPAGPWSAVAGAPVVVDGNFTVRVPANQAHQFFRLRQP